jgi:hypothetical protein
MRRLGFTVLLANMGFVHCFPKRAKFRTHDISSPRLEPARRGTLLIMVQVLHY